MARKNKKTDQNEINETEVNILAEDTVSDFDANVEVDAAIFSTEEAETEGFLPESQENSDEAIFDSEEAIQESINLEGTELDQYQAEDIEEVNFIEDERAESIVESILFASDRPVSLASICDVFKGTNIKKNTVRRILDSLAVEYAGGRRGVTLEEITGGYQLRTKIDNMNFLKSTVKARPFKLSGPALETLSIVAYKQPVVKNEIDQIRGVESGHLLRALMEKGLVNFEGKAENLPGRPMQYGTTRRFLEIFGLRNIKELPTLSQIDELLPEGITEEEAKPTLSTVTDSMSQDVTTVSYSQGEEELGLIEGELSSISTSSEFFEQEKIRQKQKRDAEKAQDIRDAMIMGEAVSTRDKNWLTKYEESLNAPMETSAASTESSEDSAHAAEDVAIDENQETIAALEAAEFSDDMTIEDESVEDELHLFEEADGEESLT